jgi:hypothetical protein
MLVQQSLLKEKEQTKTCFCAVELQAKIFWSSERISCPTYKKRAVVINILRPFMYILYENISRLNSMAENHRK